MTLKKAYIDAKISISREIKDLYGTEEELKESEIVINSQTEEIKG